MSLANGSKFEVEGNWRETVNGGREREFCVWNSSEKVVSSSSS